MIYLVLKCREKTRTRPIVQVEMTFSFLLYKISPLLLIIWAFLVLLFVPYLIIWADPSVLLLGRSSPAPHCVPPPACAPMWRRRLRLCRQRQGDKVRSISSRVAAHHPPLPGIHSLSFALLLDSAVRPHGRGELADPEIQCCSKCISSFRSRVGGGR